MSVISDEVAVVRGRYEYGMMEGDVGDEVGVCV